MTMFPFKCLCYPLAHKVDEHNSCMHFALLYRGICEDGFGLKLYNCASNDPDANM